MRDMSTMTSKNFKVWRKTAQLSQKQLAALLQTTEREIALYERGYGVIPPSAKMIVFGRGMAALGEWCRSREAELGLRFAVF